MNVCQLPARKRPSACVLSMPLVGRLEPDAIHMGSVNLVRLRSVARDPSRPIGSSAAQRPLPSYQRRSSAVRCQRLFGPARQAFHPDAKRWANLKLRIAVDRSVAPAPVTNPDAYVGATSVLGARCPLSHFSPKTYPLAAEKPAWAASLIFQSCRNLSQCFD